MGPITYTEGGGAREEPSHTEIIRVHLDRFLENPMRYFGQTPICITRNGLRWLIITEFQGEHVEKKPKTRAVTRAMWDKPEEGE